MKQPRSDVAIPGSFRDPSGFIFRRDGVVYRQVNKAYQEHYDRLMACGLYKELVGEELIVSHTEVDVEPPDPRTAYKVIEPERVRFVSYPYEWCFSELKDAALALLKIQKKAVEYGMTLKDASAYNIQFHRGHHVLIDTLSFEVYGGGPWVAYRQFCQHFLSPLALMSFRDARLNQLSRVYLDGIPLDLASALLPYRSRLSLPILAHIHLHSKSQRKYAGSRARVEGKMSRMSLLGLLDNLESSVKNLSWKFRGVGWVGYYEETNYTEEAWGEKKRVVAEFIDDIRPSTVWDLGSNVGVFSRIASEKGAFTVSFDMDPGCVEQNYVECKKRGDANLLPLVLDLTNPSPGIGWCNRERMTVTQRGPADAVLALALIHHLAISNNLPFGKIADFLSETGEWLIVEYVPKSDSQVQRLLATREDVFSEYTKEDFEREFGKRFSIVKALELKQSGRIMYLMRNRGVI